VSYINFFKLFHQKVPDTTSPAKKAIVTGTVLASGLITEKVNANKYSFQEAIKAKSPVVTSAGAVSGKLNIKYVKIHLKLTPRTLIYNMANPKITINIITPTAEKWPTARFPTN
jgi:hypothetical protein